MLKNVNTALRVLGKATALLTNYPAHACAARGYVIGRGVYIYIVYLYNNKSALFFGTKLLSPKILTFRGLF